MERSSRYITIDDQFKLEALQRNGLALKHLTAGDQDNEGFAHTAIENNALALQYASSRLRKDKDFMLATAKKNGLILLQSEFFSMDIDIESEAKNTLLAALKKMTSSEKQSLLSDISQKKPKIASEMESALKLDKPLCPLKNTHFLFT